MQKIDFNFREIRRSVDDQRRERQDQIATPEDEKLSGRTKTSRVVGKRSTALQPSFQDFRLAMAVIALIGSFYNAIGVQEKAQEQYVLYVRLIER